MIDFEIRDSEFGYLVYAGVLQERVARLHATGKLSFEYLIRDTNGSLNGMITGLQTTNFFSTSTDVDFNTSGGGTIAPSAASRSITGSIVTFDFSTNPVYAGMESEWLYIITDADEYATGGLTTLSVSDGNTVAIPTVKPLVDPCGSAMAGDCCSVERWCEGGMSHGQPCMTPQHCPGGLCLGTYGCSDVACCASVCQQDPSCCGGIGWDELCVSYAANDPNCACGHVGTGACCLATPLPGGRCWNGWIPELCAMQGVGEYGGDGSTCADGCGCCIPGQACASGVPASTCTTQGGLPVVVCRGDNNAVPGDDACESPPSIGACCHDFSCSDGVDRTVCETQLRGRYGGDGSTCANTTCYCCEAQDCFRHAGPACVASGGVPVEACTGRDDDQDGLDDACPGQSCCRDGECDIWVEGYCVQVGGRIVDECLGDNDGSGIDDACEAEVCSGGATGDCCSANETPGCSDESCCAAVCQCDPFCCEVVWDDACAAYSVDDFCGALVFCPELCAEIDDCNGNGIADDVELAAGLILDCNANGIPDECDVIPGVRVPSVLLFRFDEPWTTCDYGEFVGARCTTSNDCGGAPCTTNIIVDYSGYGNHGSNDSLVSYSSDTPFPAPDNYCLDYAQVGPEGGAIKVPIAPGSILSYFEAITIEFFIRPTEITDEFRMLFIVEGAYSLALAEGSLTLSINGHNVRFGALVPFNVWTHVAVTYSGSWAMLYLDGVLSSAVPASYGPIGPIGPDLLYIIPNRQGAGHFLGQIDQVRIVPRVLSRDEILYDATHTFTAGESRDCNGNAVPDECDVANGTSEDVNANTRPDECEDPVSLAHARITQALAQLEQEAVAPIRPGYILFTDGGNGRPIPHFVGAKVPVPSNLPDDLVVRALDHLIRHRKLYDIQDPLRQLFPSRMQWVQGGPQPDPPLPRVYFGQHFNGTAVYGADLVVALSHDLSTVLSTNGYYLPGDPGPEVVYVSASAAASIATDDLTANNVAVEKVIGDTKLMWFNEGLFTGRRAETRLGWRVTVLAASSAWVYLIDTQNGDVLSAHDQTRMDRPDKNFDINTANGSGSGQCFDWTWRAPWDEWYDEDGPCCDYPSCSTRACPAVCDSPPRCGSLGCSSDGDMLYCFIHETYDYFYDRFHYHSFDGEEAELEAYVNWGWNCPNAFAFTGSNCLAFCPGQVALDVVGHEYTHLVIGQDIGAATSRLVYRDQPGALSEGFADFFGEMVEFADNPAAGTWLAGTRNLSNPPAGCLPDHMLPAVSGDNTCTTAGVCGVFTNSAGLRPPPTGGVRNAANDWGCVHTNSSIPNKAMFLTTDGGAFNGFIIPGMGRRKAEQLYFHVMRDISSTAQFVNAAAEAVLTAEQWRDSGRWAGSDDDLVFTDTDVCTVRNAWASVGAYNFPDTDCDGDIDPIGIDDDGDGIPNDRDLCPNLRSSDNTDTDGDGLANPCDPDDDGDGINDNGDGTPAYNPCGLFTTSNCDDNCPLVANGPSLGTCVTGRVRETCVDSDACDTTFGANDGVCRKDQGDVDGNGTGDLCDDMDEDTIVDAFDNCALVSNYDQLDSDGDCPTPPSRIGSAGCGDACDPNDDRDSIPDDGDGSGDENDNPCTGGDTTDCDDNCRTVDNPNQEDLDLDGVGDLCDNCAGTNGCPAAANFWQANTDCANPRGVGDCDECGDECDDDIDGDGIPNGSDNCVYVPNPLQLDLDHNGRGAMCDPGERQMLEGLPYLGNPMIGSLIFPDLEDTMRIPIFLCAADGPGCGYLGPDFTARVVVTLPSNDLTARVVNDSGFAVAAAPLGTTEIMLEFAPTSDTYFDSSNLFGWPPNGSASGKAAGVEQQPYRGNQYYLEISLSPDAVPGQEYEVSISVDTSQSGQFCFGGTPTPAEFGVSITDPEPLNSTAWSDNGDDVWPRAASDQNGNWVAVWASDENLNGIGTDWDILVARSSDNGLTWTDPVPLHSNAATDSGMDFYAEVATDGLGHWVAVWNSRDTLDNTIGDDQDILVVRSSDNGATWTDPTPLSSNATISSPNLDFDVRPRIATDGTGQWLVVWDSSEDINGIGIDADILAARSSDNGATWSDPVAVMNTAASDTVGDFHATVGTDGTGTWVVAWQHYVASDFRDGANILLARSTDGGATWTDAIAFTVDGGPKTGNHVLADLANDGMGNWMMVWRFDGDPHSLGGTDQDILVARSSDNALTWSDPQLISASAASESSGDRFPQVTTDANGNWLAIWSTDEDPGGDSGPDMDIFVVRSADNGATWTTPTSLNTNSATDSGRDNWARIVADGQGHWLALWGSADNLGARFGFGVEPQIGTDFDILMARSSDAGATWTDPAPLNNNADSDSGRDFVPRLASDAAGNWLAVWSSQEDREGLGSDGDLLAAHSSDNGATWTDPVAINHNAQFDDYHDTGPAMSTDGAGTWVVVWSLYEYDFPPGAGVNHSDILVSRSTDNGSTWTDAELLSTDPAADIRVQGNSTLATDGRGTWIAVWNGPENVDGGPTGRDNDLYYVRSVDNGDTWTESAPLNSNAAVDSGVDALATVTADGAGNWVVIWQSTEDLDGIGTDYDMLVIHSSDNGLTWTDPAPLNNNAHTDTGYDGKRARLTTDGAGHWLAAWVSNEDLGGIGTDSDILVARSCDNGATWTDPIPLNSDAALDDRNDEFFGELTTDRAGNWVAVWGSGGVLAPYSDIMVARSTDIGDSWTDPVRLNVNGVSDFANDALPRVRTDGAGNWVVIWQSNDFLDELPFFVVGTLGTDFDILVARFQLPIEGNCPSMAADSPQPFCDMCSDCLCGECEDGRVQMCEMIGYACAWKSGCNDDLAGMTRAASVWRNGECYCWDDGQQDWFPMACPAPRSGCCLAGAAAGADQTVGRTNSTSAGSAVASIGPRSEDLKQGRSLTVAITLNSSEEVTAVALEYVVPKGWEVVEISDGGEWDGIHRRVKWGPLFDDLSRTVKVTMRLLTRSAHTDGFSGTVSFDGINQPIERRIVKKELRPRR